MKIIFVVLYRVFGTRRTDEQKTDVKPPVRLASHEDLSSFSFFAKKNIRETLNFGCRQLVFVTPAGGRQRCAINDDLPYVINVYHKAGNMAACVVTDKEYPAGTAFKVVERVMKGFVKECKATSFNPNSIRDDVSLIYYVHIHCDGLCIVT
jgi:hypothetical protein